MARSVPYYPDPAALDHQLSIEEIEVLRQAGGNPFKDRRVVDHFLARCHHTIRTYQVEFNRLHRQVSEMSIRSGHTGVPTTLDPRDAVRYLPRAELAELVEGHLRAQVQILDGLTRETEAQMTRAVALVNQIKYLLLSLTESGDLDPSSRATLERLYRSLPPDEALVLEAGERSAQLEALLGSREPAGRSPLSEAAPLSGGDVSTSAVGATGLEDLFDDTGVTAEADPSTVGSGDLDDLFDEGGTSAPQVSTESNR